MVCDFVFKEVKMKNRALSVRLSAEALSEYSGLIEGAGLTVSEHVRKLIDDFLSSVKSLDLTGLAVDCKFIWNEDVLNSLHPEYLGNLIVTVTPPSCLSQENLSRLIFTIPEFFEDRSEPFRIDSHYYHRVASDSQGITSSKVHRCVLSFRLIDGKWRACIFHYHGVDERSQLEEMIKSAVTLHIKSTIICFLLSQLPSVRLLDREDIQKADELVKQYIAKE